MLINEWYCMDVVLQVKSDVPFSETFTIDPENPPTEKDYNIYFKDLKDGITGKELLHKSPVPAWRVDMDWLSFHRERRTTETTRSEQIPGMWIGWNSYMHTSYILQQIIRFMEEKKIMDGSVSWYIYIYSIPLYFYLILYSIFLRRTLLILALRA